MQTPLVAAEVLQREFLGVRAKLIDLAAVLDRIDRAEGSVSDDPRWDKIHGGLQILAGRTSDRAEQLQLLFALPYREAWQKEYGL